MRNQTALATPALAAHLTHKQADILCYLDAGETPGEWFPLSGLVECLQMFHDEDMHESGRPLYFGVSKEAIRSTLGSLIRRGIVEERTYRCSYTAYVQQERYYKLTPQGVRAAESMM